MRKLNLHMLADEQRTKYISYLLTVIFFYVPSFKNSGERKNEKINISQ